MIISMDRQALNEIRRLVLGRLPVDLCRAREYFTEIAGINPEGVDIVLLELTEEGQLQFLPDGRFYRLQGAPITPAYHKSYKVGTRVSFKLTGFPDEVEITGRIDGISYQHLFYTYMVTLDKPLSDPHYKNWKVVSVHGTMITAEL
jgi:hypothetical protein